MTRFEEIKNNRPHLLCTCGHTAGGHLYCGDHLCILCECEGYQLDAALETSRLPMMVRVTRWVSHGYVDEFCTGAQRELLDHLEQGQ